MPESAPSATKSTRMQDLWLRFLLWRERHIKEKTFVIVLALLTGIFGGFMALLLKFLIHFISSLLSKGINITEANYLYLIYPVVGILLCTIFVKFWVKDNISHGVTRVLYAISQNKSRLIVGRSLSAYRV